MMYTNLIIAAALLPGSFAQETVYGVYIFHRHGDRTPKSTPPANLTDLGYSQVYTRGEYYRSRYVTGDASLKVKGLNTDLVKQSQIAVTAPKDTVLQNSALGFLQGLYPPVGRRVETLRNGSQVAAPFNGYQLIPINLVSSGTGSEDNGWLQDASGCENAKISSNNYFTSKEYTDKLASTRDLYDKLVPVVNGTFAAKDVTFKNAYTIYDVINVAEIHNATIPSDSVLDSATLHQARTLADSHEYGLAYNATDNIRAMPGMQLAAEIVKFLSNTVASKGASKLGIQFGAYASFLSFFGLSNLTAASPDFYGVPDYASSMVFELFSNGAAASEFPSADDLQIRFLFHNGSAASSADPTPFALFGGNDMSIPWNRFSEKMEKFAIGTAEQWCNACGNSTGTCAGYGESGTSSSQSAPSHHNRHGISAAVGGVIGAMVTLAVLLGLGSLVILVGGMRLVSKKRLVDAGEYCQGLKERER
ncbi:phosphoglycerate mutase-like protein [Tothia fuscella]|uniref:Phosphoglycerate mutase-like protein n=1 Tax=Tothia fuscella TaxID=1048955 RepID=A0A9P4NEE4_9PEZI|nr:phosphoglycerate mutase-like protein [Tothia fuscella]